MTHRFFLAATLLAAACTAGEINGTGDEPLQMEIVDDTAIGGTFVHGGTVIEFLSQSPDQQYATLSLTINGAHIDVELDLANEVYSEDGYLNALYAPELAALTALRDEIQAQYPEVVIETLQGKLLTRHADRLSEAPVGYTLDYRFVDIAAARQAKTVVNRADADGCGGDGATCFWGTNGWNYAVFDPGNDGQCVWQWAQYGEDEPNCAGRCGGGCNHWFDDDYTWDCFDHDRCVTSYGGSDLSGNPNCGDEFWDAADDYVVTYGPWC